MDKVLHWFWQFGVNYILYFFLFVSVIWTLKQFMFSTLKESIFIWNYKRRIRSHKGKAVLLENEAFKHPMLKHLQILLKTTQKKDENPDVKMFVSISVIFGAFSTVLLFIATKDLFFALIIGALLALVPYIILRLRLNKLRHLMSIEFLNIVQRLTQNYNSTHYNMYYALSETQKEIKNPLLRKVIVRLISDLQVSRNESELKESIQVFIYTAGTNWAKRLGSIILKSYLHNEKVLNALIVLTKQMEETEEMLEEEKSQTIDTVLNGYITLPVFILSLVLGYYTAAAQNWWNLQFGNQVTLLLFILCVIGTGFSIIISFFLKRPKNDL